MIVIKPIKTRTKQPATNSEAPSLQKSIVAFIREHSNSRFLLEFVVLASTHNFPRVASEDVPGTTGSPLPT